MAEGGDQGLDETSLTIPRCDQDTKVVSNKLTSLSLDVHCTDCTAPDHQCKKVPTEVEAMQMEYDRPNRPLSAFFFFCVRERDKLYWKHPEYSCEERERELARMWVEADDERKSRCKALEEENYARYVKEMTAYKKKYNLPDAPLLEPGEIDDEALEEEFPDDEEDI